MVDPNIFRAYDIRGIVDKELTLDSVYAIGRAFGTKVRETGNTQVVIGRDGRHSGPKLMHAFSQGVCHSGVDVIDIGQVCSPQLYYAAQQLPSCSGAILTGSHNPPDYNGIKLLVQGESLADADIQALYHRITEQNFIEGAGLITTRDIRAAYIDAICHDIHLKRQLKVVVDCGSGVAGDTVPALLRALGCDVIPLYCDVDGDFPFHHPDPSVAENLVDLIDKTQAEQADCGLAFDGDGDRLGVVSPTGHILWPDTLMHLFIDALLPKHPGKTIIFDVKCSQQLAAHITACGGKPLMWKTGHSLIKQKIKQTNALFAGEMSGHLFFNDRWFGFDDAPYAAARLLELISAKTADWSMDDYFARFSHTVQTPELKVPVSDQCKHALIGQLCDRPEFNHGHRITIDGLRVEYNDGWGLIRASNTTPNLVLRFEADDASALTRIMQTFTQALRAIAPSINLPEPMKR